MVLRSRSVWRPAARRTFEISRGLRHIDQKGGAGRLFPLLLRRSVESRCRRTGVHVVCGFRPSCRARNSVRTFGVHSRRPCFLPAPTRIAYSTLRPSSFSVRCIP